MVEIRRPWPYKAQGSWLAHWKYSIISPCASMRGTNLVRFSGHQNGCGQLRQFVLDSPYSFYISRFSLGTRSFSGVQLGWVFLSSCTGCQRSWPLPCFVVQSPTTGTELFQGPVGMFWRSSMHLQGSTWVLTWESCCYRFLLSGGCKCRIARRLVSLPLSP